MPESHLRQFTFRLPFLGNERKLSGDLIRDNFWQIFHW